ncbi:MAG: VOC family protein [Clostridiales Family XIII bacterium]|jgi:catechol 2,3-dioxygenase-like lactoylglutathione lyase family enzyme|nr:VOC family protein [Clostridiales Family XIII bacterium]
MEQYITGLQHVGIKAEDIEASTAFYEDLGFKVAHRTNLDEETRVVYLEQKGLIVELIETKEAPGTGVVDHITIDVTDIEAVFAEAQEKGYTIVEGGGINFLPFWERGIKFIMLEGPSGERVELNQML